MKNLDQFWNLIKELNEENKNICSIYTIESNIIIFYVGCSTNIKNRLKSHKRNFYNFKKCKYKSIKYNGKQNYLYEYMNNFDKIKMSVIHNCELKDVAFWESHYIWLYKSWGFTLVNVSFKGGEGI